MKQIGTVKVSEMVEKQIENWITSGNVQLGEKLPSVRELCEQFQVGRSAVRDAITSLKGKGMLEVKQGEGAYVCITDNMQAHLLRGVFMNTPKDISNLYTVRKMLEVGIAELAAQRRKAEHIEKLKSVVGDLQSSDREKAGKADAVFHQTLAEATQNDVLEQLMRTISSTMHKAIMDCHRIILSDPTRTEIVIRQHLGIYDAVIAGRAQVAKEQMLTHLTYVEELFHQHLFILE